LKHITHLYPHKVDILAQLDLKPHETHVFELAKHNSEIATIIKNSELLEFDTLRFLYLFMILEVLSPENYDETVRLDEVDSAPIPSTFTSFEEALKYYNLKYELIYRILSKEIGPIALSILLKAIQGITETLPPYLKNIKLNSDGSLRKDLILKSVWYHDFETYSGEFLRGLEEILYAEIYAIKKHLGVEYEQQILRWINAAGS
jgi:hypothetical protein